MRTSGNYVINDAVSIAAKLRDHILINPSTHGHGALYAPPLVFLPFAPNFFRKPIPQNSWPYKTFCCGYPHEKKVNNFTFTPSQSTLKYGSENRLLRKGLKTKKNVMQMIWMMRNGLIYIKSIALTKKVYIFSNQILGVSFIFTYCYYEKASWTYNTSFMRTLKIYFQCFLSSSNESHYLKNTPGHRLIRGFWTKYFVKIWK